MARKPPAIPVLTPAQARRIWITAQRLDIAQPFGAGPEAVAAAVRHLGYVQIDTINVIERCHHHILFSRIPDYRTSDLAHAQGPARSVFEYWTHALSYAPAEDFRFFMRAMRQDWRKRAWFGMVKPADIKRLIERIRTDGPLTIRDIDDDELVEKDHAWASRKPSKRALQLAFYQGLLTISARDGMVKTYELAERHFGWETLPKAASDTDILAYQLDRALKAQGVVSLDSICHLDAGRKPAMEALIARHVKRKQLAPVGIAGAEKIAHWAEPAALEQAGRTDPALTHILSPFDPLIIQRKRLRLLFGYDHVFEAYVPKEKRRFGYFTLPVLAGDEIVAALDLKTDRQAGKLLVQSWHWVGAGEPARHKAQIEAELARFERFQLNPDGVRPV
jgi:uncharacterized protein